jgi:hypothetical protein
VRGSQGKARIRVNLFLTLSDVETEERQPAWASRRRWRLVLRHFEGVDTLTNVETLFFPVLLSHYRRTALSTNRPGQLVICKQLQLFRTQDEVDHVCNARGPHQHWSGRQ